MRTDNIEVLINVDEETPASIQGAVVRVDWSNIGEGLCGDYNPEDPEDVQLLRFDVYVRDENGWRPVDDASYCTMVQADTDIGTLVELLWIIYKEYSNVLESDVDTSVKKLGEGLSWISA